MRKRIGSHIRSLIPLIKEDEGFSLETKSFPEKIFYKVVDNIRSLFNLKIDRKKNLFFDQFFVDTIIFFGIFFSLCYVFYYLPMEYLSNDPSKNIVLGQLFVLVLLNSIIWAGYVYIIQSFKSLTREKFIPAVNKIPKTRLNYPRLFSQFFRGFRVEWNSGFGINFYIRSYLIGMPLILGIVFLTITPIIGSISEVFFSHNIDALISLYLSIVVLSIGAIAVFFAFLILITIPVIFLYLLIVVRFLPLDINSFHEMGGTGRFGNIIINCIFLSSFAIGTMPILSTIGKLDLTSFHIPIPEGNVGNATTFIKGEIVKSVNAIPINSFSKYVGFIEFFLFFILLALLVITALHYRIKQNKEEMLTNLERIISDTDFTCAENKETNLYYLALYEKISATSEWPIKKIFAIELIISVLPLFISLLFP